MAYIRMDKDLEDDPRVVRLAEELARQLMAMSREQLAAVLEQLGCDAVIGGLYRLWRHGDTHLRRHDRLGIASHRLAHVTGFPASLFQHFPEDWLRIHEDGSVELPGYSAKNALIDKDERRAKGRERTRRYRERLRQRDAENGVTEPRHKRHKDVTTGTGTGPGPGPVPTGTGTGTETGCADAPGAKGAGAQRGDFRSEFLERFGAEPTAMVAMDRERKP